jgi:hypothetical protein
MSRLTGCNKSPAGIIIIGNLSFGMLKNKTVVPNGEGLRRI